MCDAIINHQNDHPLIYAYWDALDNLMHLKGVNDINVFRMMENISRQVEYLSQQINEDTGLIVIADHGHINISTLFFEDDPELCSFFSRPPSIEGRTCSFQIKTDQHEAFENYFKKHYRLYFHLYARQEAYEMELFGKGQKHSLMDIIIGDYIAVAYDCYMFSDYHHDIKKGNHAGLTKEEREVPLILYPS